MCGNMQPVNLWERDYIDIAIRNGADGFDGP